MANGHCGVSTVSLAREDVSVMQGESTDAAGSSASKSALRSGGSTESTGEETSTFYVVAAQQPPFPLSECSGGRSHRLPFLGFLAGP